MVPSKTDMVTSSGSELKFHNPVAYDREITAEHTGN